MDEKILFFLTPTTLAEIAKDLYDADTDDPAVLAAFTKILEMGKALIGQDFAQMVIEQSAAQLETGNK